MNLVPIADNKRKLKKFYPWVRTALVAGGKLSEISRVAANIWPSAMWNLYGRLNGFTVRRRLDSEIV